MFYKDDPQAMIWQDREAFNKRYIEKLRLEDTFTLNNVLEYLGSPDLTYAKRDGEQVWQVIFIAPNIKPLTASPPWMNVLGCYLKMAN